MIPLQLQLKNFMAYKTEATLDFAEFHTACLSGENGAGKSTLLDAITWALWGKARVRADDDLIHLGQEEMEVAFTFSLNAETYRVLRRRSKKGRGKSELHFHTAEAGGWLTLSENSIRQTQAKVDRLLRIDYDTFINSAFLLQGRADEFTAHKAADRKKILGDILGLGIYDDYADRAGEKGRVYRDKIKDQEGQIKQIETEMAREGEYQRQKIESQTKVNALSKALKEAEEKLTHLRQQVKELTYKRDQCDLLTERLKQDQAHINTLEKKR